MGLLDFFRKKAAPKLHFSVNQSGVWLFNNNDNADTYIDGGFKELPNVYGLIMAILKKSTIVPFEIYKVKSRSAEQKYKALLKDGKNVARIKQIKNDAFDQVYDSDLEKLLFNPNSYQTLEELWSEIDGYKLLTGNSYLYDGIGARGIPKELHNIPSPFVDMKVSGPVFDPIVKYVVSYLSQQIDGENLMHFKNWNPVSSYGSPNAQLIGQSPLQSCRMLLGRYKDADITQGFMFKNQGPGGLLTGEGSDAGFGQEQAIALKDAFRQQHQGTTKANDILITPNKMSWTSIGLSPVDLNITEGKKEIINELCNAYNYPAELFGGDKKFNNFEQARKSALTDAAIPLVEARKQILNKFLAPKFGEDLRIEFDYTIFHELQDDFEKQAKTAASMYWITPNEKREMTGYDQLEVDGMDDVLIPSGLSTLGDVVSSIDEIDVEKLNPETDEV